jgi:plasmid maintenance system antidote protein VapI
MNAVATEVRRIPEDELDELWFAFRQETFGKLQSAYRESGFQSQDVAHRIGKDPASVSRCLRGKENITLRTMHALARGMGCRLRVEVDRISEIQRVNREHGEAWHLDNLRHADHRGATSGVNSTFRVPLPAH